MLTRFSVLRTPRSVFLQPTRTTYGIKQTVFTGTTPTSEYIPPTPDRPRYSLKRFNLQLSQSIFCRTPNEERTWVVYRIMNHDKAIPDQITFYLLFSAIKVHQSWYLVSFYIKDTKTVSISYFYFYFSWI